ncbi:hypothetical protein CEXT_2161 [Caerostris extrusa]|uniref:Uncharacterized protein n=1 Tax=Caerostris extrusa TaxID=172846 RepID=A0AAV4SLZ1_CAEEX|nr:hypothetical protein CEXT_2161 [Caerostris extrusa]
MLVLLFERITFSFWGGEFLYVCITSEEIDGESFDKQFQRKWKIVKFINRGFYKPSNLQSKVDSVTNEKSFKPPTYTSPDFNLAARNALADVMNLSKTPIMPVRPTRRVSTTTGPTRSSDSGLNCFEPTRNPHLEVTSDFIYYPTNNESHSQSSKTYKKIQMPFNPSDPLIHLKYVNKSVIISFSFLKDRENGIVLLLLYTRGLNLTVIKLVGRVEDTPSVCCSRRLLKYVMIFVWTLTAAVLLIYIGVRYSQLNRFFVTNLKEGYTILALLVIIVAVGFIVLCTLLSCCKKKDSHSTSHSNSIDYINTYVKNEMNLETEV